MARIRPLDDAELLQRGIALPDAVQPTGISLNNCLRTMARKPGLVEAMHRLAQVVMLDPGSVPAELKWLVAHVVSNAAGCRYCTAHTVYNGARRTTLAQEKIDAVWEFRTNAMFSAAERAALELSLAAGSAPPTVTDAHFAELSRHFSEDQIVEIVAVIAYFGWFNRWNDTMQSDLESGPLQFKSAHAVASGWRPDKSDST
ncbi:MAG: carboxymuconolactone decarboxylase family protein [Burkholderiales bacterium]